ncbi:TetR/AcrR family transcriptional regulator [Nonomuraea antimicrobica]|uniref:TetR/AcrR family transcriptional regulator n=2 Tax=Nonomuraea antimicrobica TaxID=561173 RepID=A0ABP7C5F8_9ACTN
MNGRKAQAARNDELILRAARAVFTGDPGAPVAAVAERAGVGISALYRRYPSKEALLQKLCGDGLKVYIEVAERALADDGDPWEAFAGYLRGIVDADVHSLTIKLAGSFTPTEELFRDSARASELAVAAHQRAVAAGVLRPDVTVADVALLFELMASIRLGDEERTAQLRHRYLTLTMDALRVPPAHGDLPGPPPQDAELTARWVPSS